MLKQYPEFLLPAVIMFSFFFTPSQGIISTPENNTGESRTISDAQQSPLSADQPGPVPNPVINPFILNPMPAETHSSPPERNPVYRVEFYLRSGGVFFNNLDLTAPDNSSLYTIGKSDDLFWDLFSLFSFHLFTKKNRPLPAPEIRISRLEFWRSTPAPPYQHDQFFTDKPPATLFLIEQLSLNIPISPEPLQGERDWEILIGRFQWPLPAPFVVNTETQTINGVHLKGEITESFLLSALLLDIMINKQNFPGSSSANRNLWQISPQLKQYNGDQKTMRAAVAINSKPLPLSKKSNGTLSLFSITHFQRYGAFGSGTERTSYNDGNSGDNDFTWLQIFSLSLQSGIINFTIDGGYSDGIDRDARFLSGENLDTLTRGVHFGASFRSDLIEKNSRSKFITALSLKGQAGYYQGPTWSENGNLYSYGYTSPRLFITGGYLIENLIGIIPYAVADGEKIMFNNSGYRTFTSGGVIGSVAVSGTVKDRMRLNFSISTFWIPDPWLKKVNRSVAGNINGDFQTLLPLASEFSFSGNYYFHNNLSLFLSASTAIINRKLFKIDLLPESSSANPVTLYWGVEYKQ